LDENLLGHDRIFAVKENLTSERMSGRRAAIARIWCIARPFVGRPDLWWLVLRAQKGL
jgi:hypothetical protein